MDTGAAEIGSNALATVQAIYAAIASGDVAAAMDLLSPDVVVRQAGALPMAGEWHGKEGFAAMAAVIAAAWPGFAVEPRLMLANDETVLVLTRISGAKGSLDQPMVERWRVVRGRAVECQPFYFDTTAASAVAIRGI